MSEQTPPAATMTRRPARRPRTLATLVLAAFAIAGSDTIVTPLLADGPVTVAAAATRKSPTAPALLASVEATPNGADETAQVLAATAAAAAQRDGELEQLSVALAAAGLVVEDELDVPQLERAAVELDVTLEPSARVDSSVQIAALEQAAWDRGEDRMTAAGLDFDGPLAADDVSAAAADLGVAVSDPIAPVEVDAVITAGQQVIADTLAGAELPEAGKLDTGALAAVGAAHGVELAATPSPADVRAFAAAVAAAPTLRYATVGGVGLRLPARQPVYVGFHESATAAALKQTPTGDVATHLLPSRGRGTSPTSAVDVVMAPGERVYAPVTGTVVEAMSYTLYGAYADQRLRIVPDDAPHLLVSVLHVEGLQVAAGERVVAGETVVASQVRKFPFESQIDEPAGRSWGHVHIEARPR